MRPRKTLEMTVIETDFFKRFKESTKEVSKALKDWIKESKKYESVTRAQLFAQYKILEDKVANILNKNKQDSKDHTMAVRREMQGRRAKIREL
jgi:energy-converting hydrogenase A subunit M